jgi:hypothetical protein
MSQMSSIDISCRGPPLGIGKHRAYIPQGFRGQIEGDILEGSPSKTRRSSNSEERHLKNKRVRAADMVDDMTDDTDRLYNRSCSLLKAKHYILESFTASSADAGSLCGERIDQINSVHSLLLTRPEGSQSIPPRSKIPPPPMAPAASPYDLNIPSIVSAALFRTQSGALRSLHGYTDTSIADPSYENGPLWGLNAEQSAAGESGPELFFKMAVCTGSTASGVWCDRDSFGVNMLRALLSGQTGAIGPGRGTGTGSGSGTGNESDVNVTEKMNIHLTRQYVPCHQHRTGEVESRYTNVSVVDICGGDLSSPSHYVANAMRSSMQGSQAVLIVIPHEGWTDPFTGVKQRHYYYCSV